VVDESVERISLLTSDGIFGEDGQPVGAELSFTDNYAIDTVYVDEEYSWLADVEDWVKVINIEYVEAAEDVDGDWYRVTVEVSDDAPVGNHDIIAMHLTGDIVIEYTAYEITGGREGSILYVAGNHYEELGNAYVKITDSTCNDGVEYETAGDTQYDEVEDRTEVWMSEILPCETYDGYITKLGDIPLPT
jgi:hypothetical protein